MFFIVSDTLCLWPSFTINVLSLYIKFESFIYNTFQSPNVLTVERRQVFLTPSFTHHHIRELVVSDCTTRRFVITHHYPDFTLHVCSFIFVFSSYRFCWLQLKRFSQIYFLLLGNCPTWCTNSFQCIYLFIVLYMFRACHVHHQEKQILSIQLLVIWHARNM